MPPKPRGRASTRARGTRGAAGTCDEGTGPSEGPDSTPQTFDAPEQEAPNDSTESSATATPQEATSQTSTPAPAQAEPRLPVKRSGSTRGAKKGPAKPVFTGRRSKEERAALEKEALEREKIRNRDREKEDAFQARKREREAAKEKGRAARGRGGGGGAMSGPFSLGSSREDRKTNPRSFSGFGAGSGSRAVRVKNEGDEGPSRSGGGGGGGGGEYSGGSSSLKREDGGTVESSEDEEDQEFPRRDIDLIEISDDDTAEPTDRPALPIRITRKEHQEKALALNTDASAETAIKEREPGRSKAGERGHSSRKGKGRASEVEITSVRKPFKGVWQDTDDSDVQVKNEPSSDDEMPDADANVDTHVDAAGQAEADAEAEAEANAEQIGLQSEVQKQEPPSPTLTRKPPPRRSEPILQTDEDRAEWTRFLQNRRHIRAELGPDDTTTASETTTTTPDGEASEAKPETTTAAAPKPSVRDNNVYLFQIPPLMPSLHPPGTSPPIKPEPPTTTPIKTESPAPASSTPLFAPGHVGKLRVHASGATTLSWGGASFLVEAGQKASFLQEVVGVRVLDAKERVVPEEGGEAVSLGRVKGRFRVVVDWGAGDG